MTEEALQRLLVTVRDWYEDASIAERQDYGEMFAAAMAYFGPRDVDHPQTESMKPNTQLCTKCGERKPVEQFRFKGCVRRRKQCRECQNRAARERANGHLRIPKCHAAIEAFLYR